MDSFGGSEYKGSVPRLAPENLSDLDDVEYRDYKRELLRKSREDLNKESTFTSFLVCGLLVVAATLVVLHNYGLIKVPVNP